MFAWPIVKAIAKRMIPRPIYSRAQGYLSLSSCKRFIVDREYFFHLAFTALNHNMIDGDYVEFGCASATTFAHAYKMSRKHYMSCHLWAFDSFCGLPEPKTPKDQHPRWAKGLINMSEEDFHQTCKKNGIPRTEYTTVPGFYEDTLEKASPSQEPTNICLAYIDSDYYSSAMSAIQFLLPRLKHGMLIAFDDYFCWSEKQLAGERLAVHEIFANHERWNLLPFLRYTWSGMSFLVEDKCLFPNGNITFNT
ncbi:MAG: hypothetical protein GYA55_12995 [SAR324 cluster bacterium]|uniref:Methyltransferase n=1 Tax=SAR324 cluster bacterium TaxID=2024889 RepID=A0A7X9FTL3_9DELT|nr:hypothetical protein [SAR324 cluster bacterium]